MSAATLRGRVCFFYINVCQGKEKVTYCHNCLDMKFGALSGAMSYYHIWRQG